MGTIRIQDHNGDLHDIEAVEGWRVMEIIREHGFPIDGLCGGGCACATCHVYVAPQWNEKAHPARNDEEAMLDEVPTVADNSWLSCQIIYTDELDGLTV